MGYQRLIRVVSAVLVLCLLAPGASVWAQAADATVDMVGETFVPAEVHIAPGQTVMWKNSSFLSHTVTADDESFDSDDIGPRAQFSRQFDSPGTYPYYCIPHGGPGGVGMAGVIIVEDT